MNIEKADIATVIRFGNLDNFLIKLKLENKKIEDVINYIDNRNVSILERSLISRTFDIAKYLISNNAKINNISDEGYNELHFIAANINFNGALEIAYLLKERGVSLTLRDLVHGNIPIFLMCLEIIKQRIPQQIEFLKECLLDINDYTVKNNKGYSIKDIILRSGISELINIVLK